MRRCRTAGFSLIEILVVAGLISFLLAMLLPAVQAARMSAWRVKCRSNLRWLAMGVHGYHDIHNVVPGVEEVGDVILGSNGLPGIDPNSHCSLFTQILPQIDHSILFDSINFSQRIPNDYQGSIIGVGEYARAVNTTAFSNRLDGFICPSDSFAFDCPSPMSYRGNWGLGPHWFRSAEYPDSGNGFFATDGYRYSHSFASFSDGIGKTAMFAERAITREFVPAQFSEMVYDASATVNNCAAYALLTSPEIRYRRGGTEWAYAGLHHTMYTHSQPPGALIPDCLSFTFIPPVGMTTPNSGHGDVGVAMGDGSVQSIGDGIDKMIWRKIGIRN